MIAQNNSDIIFGINSARGLRNLTRNVAENIRSSTKSIFEALTTSKRDKLTCYHVLIPVYEWSCISHERFM